MILTTEPNELLRPIHDRMPVIVDPADYDRWLAPEGTAPETLTGLLKPYPAELLAARAVGPTVNNAQNEGVACLDPA